MDRGHRRGGAAHVHRGPRGLVRHLLDRRRLRRRRRRGVPGRHPHALPSRPRDGTPARERPEPGGGPMSGATVSSTPILRATLTWSAVVTAALAVIGSVIGYLVAGQDGLWS